jgi:hypothetical protein
MWGSYVGNGRGCGQTRQRKGDWGMTGAELYRHDDGVARECDVETEERLWG